MLSRRAPSGLGGRGPGGERDSMCASCVRAAARSAPAAAAPLGADGLLWARWGHTAGSLSRAAAWGLVHWTGGRPLCDRGWVVCVAGCLPTVEAFGRGQNTPFPGARPHHRCINLVRQTPSPAHTKDPPEPAGHIATEHEEGHAWVIAHHQRVPRQAATEVCVHQLAARERPAAAGGGYGAAWHQGTRMLGGGNCGGFREFWPRAHGMQAACLASSKLVPPS
jgi:hypothetical protein